MEQGTKCEDVLTGVGDEQAPIAELFFGDVTWRMVVNWMALAGKQPATAPLRRTVEAWRE
jgi:hypothetical protein